MKKKTARSAASILLAAAMLTGCASETTTTTTPAVSDPAPAAFSAAAETMAATGVVTDGQGWYLWDEATLETNRTGRGGVSETGMVAAAKTEASQAGVKVLEAGGNAIDAAVATAFALSVVEPNASGIGGGGHMLIYTADGEAHFLDFRGTAPSAATLQSWNRKAVGGQASTVPGEVAGLWYAYENYGSGNVSWEELIQPAIDLAENGFYVTPVLYKDMLDTFDYMIKYEDLGNVFLKDGLLYEIGDLFVNEGQAKALRLIAEQGPDAFYKGEIGEAIIEALEEDGGFMTMDDLADFQVRELDVVTSTYRGYTLISTPFGGASVLEAMNVMENFDIAASGYQTAQTQNILAETFQITFRDRFDYLGDPDYADIPLENLLSKSLASTRASQIRLGTTQTYKKLTSISAYTDDAYESADTTHFSVADADGNMVACTQTVNGIFGSKIAISEYGFAMNNVMDAFSTSSSSNNVVAPGKTPNSSMSPTIVLDTEGEPFLVIGSPGSRKIITTVAQVLSNVIDFGMDIQDAIDAPRIFMDTEQKFQMESRYPEGVSDAMTAMGYDVSVYDEFDKIFGSVQAIMYKDGKLVGGADPRRDGKALGY